MLIQNYVKDLSKFRIGLLSAYLTSNNNIIIPAIPIRKHVSSFNFGGCQLWNNFENNNINISNNNIIGKVTNINNVKNTNINLKKEDDELIFAPEFNKKDSISSKKYI